MSRINKHAKTLRDAVDNGQDPMTVELNDTAQGGKSKPSGNQQPYDFILLQHCPNTSTPGLIDSGEAISGSFGGDGLAAPSKAKMGGSGQQIVLSVFAYSLPFVRTSFAFLEACADDLHGYCQALRQ
jgi:hypothetical protein